jgi:circadian clock protein KaiC
MSDAVPDPEGIPRVGTGVPGLDHVSLGGYPRGRVVVVSGPAGSGKTVLAGQFLAAGAASGEPGVFVTLEETATDLRRNLSTLGFDIAGWEAAGDWAFVDGSPRYDARADGIVPLQVDTLLAQIGQAVDHTGATRLVVDAFGAGGIDRGDGLTRMRLRGLLAELRKLGVTVVMTVETDPDGADSPSTQGIEQYVGDTVVLLRNSLEGQARRRTLEVLKMRGAEHRRGQFAFGVLPGEGMVVFPLSLPDRIRGAADHRVSSGNADVDALCEGGFFADATVLVSGATGTGKTLFVTEFLMGGVARGERSLLLAFEESRDQLRRSARGWGHDLAQAERDGHLRVGAAYPESATLEDHLLEIKRQIDDFAPTRIAVDPLSALERAGSPRAFREFVISLASYIKAKEIVAVFTATTDALLGGSSVTETHISTLTDSIVVLRYVEALGTVKRAITVLKMRGSDHDRSIREFTIDNTGLHVGEPFRAIAGILSGNVLNLDHEVPGPPR